MKPLKRSIESNINAYVQGDSTKILFIWGPRRSGKTTLLTQLAQQLDAEIYNFDFVSDREKFAPRRETLEKIVHDNPIILIDEVQNYPEVTVVLKLLHDEFGIKIIATGSSELRQKSATVFDTLAGRYIELYCLPLSISELENNEKPTISNVDSWSKQVAIQAQIWGIYPEIYTTQDNSEQERIDVLTSMLETFVLKDVIDIYQLKNQKLAKDILTKIALQLGSEVSIREIAASLGAYPTTVANYIEIFVKNYILISLPSFKTNARRAVSENRKLYFYDLGIRNVLIQDFRQLELRQDKGGVFENFVIIELEKQRRLNNVKSNLYFYREYGGKEVDLVIEDYKKNYIVVEIKAKKTSTQDVFPLPHVLEVITPDNYFDRVTTLLPPFSSG